MTTEEPTLALRWLRWISMSRGPFKLQQCWQILEIDDVTNEVRGSRQEWRDVPWVEEPAPPYQEEPIDV